jgi:hypothetical protein
MTSLFLSYARLFLSYARGDDDPCLPRRLRTRRRAW